MSEPITEYKNEYLALRHALNISHKSRDVAVKSIKNLIKLGNSIGWIGLPNDLLSEVGDTLTGTVHQAMEAQNKNILQLNINVDAFFSNVVTKDIQNKSADIRKNAVIYFNSGQFSKFNTTFYRYVKHLVGENENEMNDYIIKYFISSMIKKNIPHFVDDLRILSQNYFLYDYNIFLFLISLFGGEFHGISNKILSIKRNVSEQTFELISERDLSFIFSLCLLLDFNPQVNRDMKLLNDTLVYYFYETFPEHYTILQTYQKCQYEKVVEEVLSHKNKFENDLILFYLSEKIQNLLKKNILKEILVTSSSVEIKYFKNVLKISDELAIEQMIFQCIRENNLTLQIDDISKCVYYVEDEPINNTLKKCLSVSKSNLAHIMNYTFEKTLRGKITNLKKNEALSQLQLDETGSMGGIDERFAMGMELGMGMGMGHYFP